MELPPEIVQKMFQNMREAIDKKCQYIIVGVVNIFEFLVGVVCINIKIDRICISLREINGELQESGEVDVIPVNCNSTHS